MARSRVKTPRSSRGETAGVSRRARLVWVSLVGAMTGVGGLLLALGGRPAPRADGMTLMPMLATASPSSIEVIFNTTSPLRKEQWQAIVIHDSGSAADSPESLDAKARGMGLRGLGYDFVIGNGNGMADGQLHVGYRWRGQLAGAHAAGKDADWFNRHAVGICLVGDGNRQRPTAAQVSQLVRLVNTLRRELGVPAERVYLHSQLAAVDSPGRLFPEAGFREQIAGEP